MPFLIVAYILAYIDRTNVGVAKLRMQPDLGFTDDPFGFGAGIFFIGYCLLEIPGALIAERWSARKWIARIMISWGLVAALMGFVGTPLFGSADLKAQFYWLRFLLGAAEAGFFPAVIVYLSHWFTVEDRTRAKAYFLIAQPLAVMIGIPVGRLILENVHWMGLEGWRWIFILEGIPALLFGLLTLCYLTDYPAEARWLAAEEKLWLIGRLKSEAQEKVIAGKVGILAAFRNRQVFLLAAVSFLIISGNQAMVFFLPSIMEGLGNMGIVTRTALTALPYLCSLAGILIGGFSSHRTGERRWHIALPMFLNGLGISLAILSRNTPGLVIAFFCLAGLAAQAYMPALWSVPTQLLGKSAAATAVGLINMVGNLGGFFGPSIFGYLRTVSGSFQLGLWFLVGCMVAAGALATRLRVRPERAPAD
jgi:Sugar phosphate permease